MTNLIPWRKKQDNSMNLRPNGSKQDDTEFHPMVRLRREMDQLIDRFWDDWSFGSWDNLLRSGRRFILEDKGDEYLVEAELPGFAAEEVDVSISGNVMTIRADHQEEENGKNGHSFRYGQFCETISLPGGIESDKINARYRNGILQVQVPKSENSKAKRIAVRSD